MKKEIKEINVKEFINEINTSSTSGEVFKKKTRKSSEATYNIVVSSGCDFIMTKTTSRTCKTLVSLLSSRILFIYDEKEGTKTIVTDPKDLKNFFHEKKADEMIIGPGELSYAKNGLTKEDIDHWFNYILSTEYQSIHYLLKRGMIDINSIYRYAKYEDLEKCYRANPNLLLYLFQNLEYQSLSDYCKAALLVTEIYDASDLDTAKYFVSQAVLSSVSLTRGYQPQSGELKEMLKHYNLNVRRYIDYMLFDMYKQGIEAFDHFTYFDYLRLCESYYGKVKDKYPKNLHTEHTRIAAKVSEKKKLEDLSPQFAVIMDEAEDFSYKNPIDKFIISMPKESIELVEEGSYLCHCVASYVEKVNARDCLVVFMREKENPDIPYLTVEILPDRSVPQVEGMNRRRELSQEEIDFINRWAKNKHLKVTAENVKNPTAKESKKETL